MIKNVRVENTQGEIWNCRLDYRNVVRCGSCLRGKVAPELGSKCRVCKAKVIYTETAHQENEKEI